MKDQAMTTPDPRAPYVPGQPAYPPYGYQGAPPQWNPTPRAPRKHGFWSTGLGFAVLMGGGLVVLVAVILGVAAVNRSAADALRVTVTGCKVTTGDLPSGTVEFTVTNTSSYTRTARIGIEYRDSSGSRLDTDTSVVRDIAPGDTVRSSESTLLDAGAADGTCRITSVS